MGRWGNADMNQLKRLQRQLQEFERIDMEAFCKECTRELAARLLTAVIKETRVGDTITQMVNQTDSEGNPVTYKRNGKNHRAGEVKQKKETLHQGGTLRRGWTAGKTAAGKAYAAGMHVTKAGNAYLITVKNPVHYASYVEFGHRQQPGRYVPAIGKRLTSSWVKGQFFLTKSEIELERKIPGILEKKLEKKLGELFAE